MASGKKRATRLDLTAENAELNRDVISTLAHELGGIASALDLRAAAMSRTIPEQDLVALREIAEEVRMATRAARFACGPDGSGILNPMRRQSLEDWWKLTRRFTGSVLPRGIAVETDFAEAQVNATQASALTWIWLAGCKEIGERGVATPATVQLHGGPGTNGANALSLTAEIDSDRLGAADTIRSRWSRYADRVAKRLGVDPPAWEQDETKTRWRFELKQAEGLEQADG